MSTILREVTYPVYPIKGDIVEEDNIIYASSIASKKYRVLDNRNLEGNFIQRRLQIPDNEKYNLRNGVTTLVELAKLSKYRLIDSAGKIFRFPKKRMYPIVKKRIESQKYVGHRVRIRYEGINFPVFSNTLRPDDELGVFLVIGRGYVFYAFGDIKQKRRIKI